MYSILSYTCTKVKFSSDLFLYVKLFSFFSPITLSIWWESFLIHLCPSYSWKSGIGNKVCRASCLEHSSNSSLSFVRPELFYNCVSCRKALIMKINFFHSNKNEFVECGWLWKLTSFASLCKLISAFLMPWLCVFSAFSFEPVVTSYLFPH